LNTALKVMSRSLRLGNKDAQSSTGMKQVFLGHAANSHQQELGIKSMSLAEVFLACITCPDRQEVCKMPAGAKLSLSLHCCLVTHKICCAALRCAVLCTTSSVVRQSYVALLHVTMPSYIRNVVRRCRPVVKASIPVCRTQNTACTVATAGQQRQLICLGQMACAGGYLFSKDEWVVALVFELPPLGLA